jgi:hypothetical protein
MNVVARGVRESLVEVLPLEARSVEWEEESGEKRVEQFPVLAGLRQYAIGDEREHVLLAKRPGSGKSTALRQSDGNFCYLRNSFPMWFSALAP